MKQLEEVQVGLTASLSGIVKEQTKGLSEEQAKEYTNYIWISVARRILELNETPPGPTRARVLHNKIDKALVAAKQRPAFKDTPCGSGCSACCHTNVDITGDEAELLAQRVREGIDIDP